MGYCCDNLLVESMSLNHELNYSLIVYLSKIKLNNDEFKVIYTGFTKAYPKFSANIYYQYIYRVVRNLTNCGLLDVKQFHYCCQYTSNYGSEELYNFLLKKGIKLDFATELNNEMIKLHTNLEKMRLEIIFFDKYVKEYPLLKDTILKVKEDSQQQLVYLESQINVLNKIKSQV